VARLLPHVPGSTELHACASQRHDQRGATDACTSHQSCHECTQQRQAALRATLRLTRLDWNMALSQCKSMLMCPPGRVRVTERRQTEYTIAISVSRSTLEVSFSSKFESLEIDPHPAQGLSAVCDRTSVVSMTVGSNVHVSREHPDDSGTVHTLASLNFTQSCKSERHRCTLQMLPCLRTRSVLICCILARICLHSPQRYHLTDASK